MKLEIIKKVTGLYANRISFSVSGGGIRVRGIEGRVTSARDCTCLLHMLFCDQRVIFSLLHVLATGTFKKVRASSLDRFQVAPLSTKIQN